MSKHTTLDQLKLLAQRTKTEIDTVSSKVDELVTAGGEPNKIEVVKVNGTALTIAEKIVDILIATGTTDGTLAVNGVDVAVKGLAALAYKAEVSEAELSSALKEVIDAKASGTDLTALTTRVTSVEGSITTLNSDATTEGSVAKQVSDAVAKIVSDAPEAYDTLKEISDWISSHADDASAMNTQITTNKNDIASLVALVGTLPEGVTSTTVVAYIGEAIAALNIGDYAKTTEVTSAISTALGDYYTKAEIDAMVATDAEVTAMLTEVFGTAS